ncbi:MAG: Spy/CpxP family protein refolding chaperone [gamma proteobacterium symbiont of Taylorina sp.]|nr:Spy/CpxP family protein refolding chaperone [gamma proteobacterium symbiont of Taylorina sp.]
MTKVKKMIIGTVFTVVTLGGIAAYATADGCGKFGGMQNKGSEFMLNRISSRLSLNAEQQQKLESLQKTMMAEMQTQQEKHPRNQMIELISEPKLNQEKALAILGERSKKMEGSAPKIITAIADFTDSLNDEQRADLKQMIDRFGMHRDPGRGSHFKGPFPQ